MKEIVGSATVPSAMLVPPCHYFVNNILPTVHLPNLIYSNTFFGTSIIGDI